MRGKVVFLTLSLFVVSIVLGCKKDSNTYELSYTINNNSSSKWFSDKVEAVIKSDSLLITAKKNDGSTVAIIVSNHQTGNYPISLTSMESLVVVNRDGSKDNSSNYLSIEGNVAITANDESKKAISGTFSIKAVRATDILNSENITGQFVTKYTKY